MSYCIVGKHAVAYPSVALNGYSHRPTTRLVFAKKAEIRSFTMQTVPVCPVKSALTV